MTDEISTKKSKFVGENETYQGLAACLDLYSIKRTAVSLFCFFFLWSATVFLLDILGLRLHRINEMNSQESFVSFCLQCIACHNLDPKIYFDASFCL